MPAPKRRDVLAGAMAVASVGTLAASRSGPRTPLAESAVLMAEDGTLTFLGMSRHSFFASFALHSRWWCYRLARRSNDAVAMAEQAQDARAGDVQMAALFRADGYGEAEIAAYLYRLQHHEADDPDYHEVSAT